MDEGGVLFGDGIEADRIEFDYGMQVSVRTSSRRLSLLVAERLRPHLSGA